jgi:pepF/M3 family oligoendopeptidase
MDPTNDKLPHWDLSNVYPSLDSPEFEGDLIKVKSLIDSLEEFITAKKISRMNVPPTDAKLDEIGEIIAEIIARINAVSQLVYTLQNYIASFTTTDSYNNTAMRYRSQIQQQTVRLVQVEAIFSGWFGSLGEKSEAIIANKPNTQAYAFYLRELASKSKYLMSDPEESLANELSLSGLRAWGKLQGTVTSQLTVDFELDGEVQTLPLAALQNIRRYNASGSMRQRAFESEIRALESVREPLSACMNGVKGFFNVINRHRGRDDALHPSLDDARIDIPTIEAMMEAINASFPMFRKYLKSKAKRLGKNALPWWDLFAPIGQNNSTFSWKEAQEFIVNNFGIFSDELASFAQRSFDHNWIDAEPRDGKRGGAFCMRIPSVEESRILCNFDGSFDQVSTVAHELGHAYHIECQKGKKYLQYWTPMTLAETASIFCETIIQEAALDAVSSLEEELAILETTLIGNTQVIVDISSRFLFEKEVFQRRYEAELSADEFCEIITRTQIATYGDGLDEDQLHPYMWAWKPHYYRYDISFYNFPYAFGLLFSTGLYSIYKQLGKEFIPEFVELLSSTGLAAPVDLAARFGIDIRSPKFWERSLYIIHKRIERYLEM